MPSPSKGRILVVDDEPLIREMAREVLENGGYTVDEAADGQFGLEKYQQEHGAYDLVILDLVMPRLHGFQVMDRILQLDPGARILISSGFSPDNRPELTQPAPRRGFLPKPYRSRDLLEQVGKLIAESQP